MRFCEMLQEIQKNKGYPATYIAELTGISRTAVHNHVVGKCFPTRSMFIAYNKVFHFVDSNSPREIVDYYYQLKSLE